MVLDTDNPRFINTIIVGGGHAGVNLGCMLAMEKKKTAQDEYLILERASTLLPKWRESRWEGFQLNTPVKHSRLYGQADERDDWSLDRPIADDIRRWDEHIAKLEVAHALNSNVVEVTKEDGQDDFTVKVMDTTRSSESPSVYRSKNLVVCNGMFDAPKKPVDISSKMPRAIKQHVPAGFKFSDLLPGNILVVGSGQSGCQIADLLVRNVPEAKIYLSTSAVPGCFRTAQGKDLFQLMEETKIIAMPRAALDAMPPDKAAAMKYGKNPVTGPNKELSPFSLERSGVVLLGGLEGVDEGKNTVLTIKPNRAANLQISLGGHRKFVRMLTAHLQKDKDATPAVDIPEWSGVKEELLSDDNPVLSLDTEDCNITNVVWCTGWSNDFTWLGGIDFEDDLDTKTRSPDVIQSKSVKGLFYCGFPWIGTLQSLNLVNFNHDAKVIMENLI